jgi:hypothetical protein
VDRRLGIGLEVGLARALAMHLGGRMPCWTSQLPANVTKCLREPCSGLKTLRRALRGGKHMSDAITSEQRQYNIEEYKTLKNELAEAFKEGFQIVVFSVTANAAVFTFVSGHPEVAKGGLFYLVSSLRFL